jgi:hypothetical protein
MSGIKEKELLGGGTECEVNNFMNNKTVDKYKYDFETNEHHIWFTDGTRQILYGRRK